MYIPLDAASYAGQAFSGNVDIGTADSAMKVGTPSRGTSQRRWLTKSLTSSAKGSSLPAVNKGGPLTKAYGGGSSVLTAPPHGTGQRGMEFGDGAFLLREQIPIWRLQDSEWGR